MMPRKKEDLEKVTINLTRGDKDTLAAFHPKSGWSVAARAIINDYCNQLREVNLKPAKIGDIKVPPLDV